MDILPDNESAVSTPIEPGEYRLRYLGHKQSAFKKQAKVNVQFEILPPSKHAGRIVSRYYNVETVKHGGKQRWKASKGGLLLREFFRLFESVLDNPASIRLHSIPLHLMADYVVIGEVAMVTHDAIGEAIPLLAQQPKVTRLLWLEGNKNETEEDLASPCLAYPCLTFPNPTSPPLVGQQGKQDTAMDSGDSVYKPDSDAIAEIQRLTAAGARSCKDIERMTDGRISAAYARELTWHLE